MTDVKPATTSLSARHLGQLLLMQSVLESLPDANSIRSFVASGLSDIPGVAEARIRDASSESPGRETLRFPLQMGEVCKGELLVTCNDLAAFRPYEDYIRNFCFMVAVILEERQQRQARESQLSTLEQQVRERTRQLQSQVTERSRAEQQVRALLAEAEESRSALLGILEDQRQVEAALREANRRLHALSMRLLEVQEAERAAIARELHDEIGQSLTALKLSAQTLQRKARGEMAAKLGECVALAARTLEQARGLTLDLRPPELEHLGLAAALREQAHRVAATAGFETEFSTESDFRALDKRLATAVFRVTQEALTNAARHSGAKNVSVALRSEGGALLVAVVDDGRGFDLALARERALGGASMGVLGMEERVALAGGTFAIATRPGGGTRVEARFPLGAA